MPEFVEPGDAETETESEDSESVPTEMPPLPTVQFMDSNMEMPMAVQEMAFILDRPSEFGIASESQLQELRDEAERYRNLALQQREVVAELAEAVDMMSEQLAEAGVGGVALDADVMEGIYDPTREFDD